MTKISLEELKARSARCSHFPRTIEIARAAKSPNAAFEWAKRELGPNDEVNRACRYLATIKRDYGDEVFENVVDELKQAACEYSFAEMSPFIQTAARLSFLHHAMQKEPGECFIAFDPHDMRYADIVELCLESIGRLGQTEKKAFMGYLQAEFYLQCARQFVLGVRAGGKLDKYCIEKTAWFLFAYVKTVCAFNGIPISYAHLCCDSVHRMLIQVVR